MMVFRGFCGDELRRLSFSILSRSIWPTQGKPILASTNVRAACLAFLVGLHLETELVVGLFGVRKTFGIDD